MDFYFTRGGSRGVMAKFFMRVKGNKTMNKCSKLSIVAIVAMLLMAFSFVPPTSEGKLIDPVKQELSESEYHAIVERQVDIANKLVVGSRITLKDKEGNVIFDVDVTESYKDWRIKVAREITTEIASKLFFNICGGIGEVCEEPMYTGVPWCMILCTCSYYDSDMNALITYSYCK